MTRFSLDNRYMTPTRCRYLDKRAEEADKAGEGDEKQEGKAWTDTKLKKHRRERILEHTKAHQNKDSRVHFEYFVLST